jgi:hypothetical protein
VKRDDPELDYYRSVEDLFASLRGNPHVLSPRDFQILRSWWRDRIPLAAVVTGLTEVFARNRERDTQDPVVSLSYCRHAVKRHARRLAEMRVGSAAQTDADQQPTETGSVDGLTERLRMAGERLRNDYPRPADVILRMADQVEIAARELPLTLLDEHLFALESAMMEDCRQALPEALSHEIDERVRETVDATAASDEARARSTRALRDRELRTLLGIPRLEVDP